MIVFFCVYNTLGKVSGSSQMEQFQASIVTNCQGLTYCMDVISAVAHELVNSLLFQCLECILRVFTIC
jgi:hypothetical protein